MDGFVGMSDLLDSVSSDLLPVKPVRFRGQNRMVGPSQQFRFTMVITKGLVHSVIPAEERGDLAGCRKN